MGYCILAEYQMPILYVSVSRENQPLSSELNLCSFEKD